MAKKKVWIGSVGPFIYDDDTYFGLKTTGPVDIGDISGDIKFIRGTGAGLIYGSCYGNEIVWTQNSAVQDTWYPISDPDMIDGQLHNVAHNGSGKLTVTYGGAYMVTYTLSGEMSANNLHLQTVLRIDGVEGVLGINHAEASKANDHMAINGCGIPLIGANGTIEVSLRTTDAGTPDIGVDHLGICIMQVGGP